MNSRRLKKYIFLNLTFDYPRKRCHLTALLISGSFYEGHFIDKTTWTNRYFFIPIGILKIRIQFCKRNYSRFSAPFQSSITEGLICLPLTNEIKLNLTRNQNSSLGQSKLSVNEIDFFHQKKIRNFIKVFTTLIDNLKL